MQARLLSEGMPDLLDLDAAAAARAAAHEGLLAYVFVASDHAESERMLRELPDASVRLLPIVVCVDEAEAREWLAEHARSFPTIARGTAAIDRVGLEKIPTVVVAAKAGAVVAVGPDAAELARLSR